MIVYIVALCDSITFIGIIRLYNDMPEIIYVLHRYNPYRLLRNAQHYNAIDINEWFNRMDNIFNSMEQYMDDILIIPR